MSQCRGTSISGQRCRKSARSNSHYCSIHASQEKKPSKLPALIGAIAGHLVAPGIGGILVGGLLGSAFVSERKESKARVFVSFDYDHDASLKHFLVGQSKHDDSPFEISDHSIKEHITGDWKAHARKRIRWADIVCVICGEHTHTSAGVGAELAIAQEESKPYFLLKGYADKVCTKPKHARTSDKTYKWTWNNLKSLIGCAR